jgi:hemerythrin-like domain-containing protein
MTPAVPTDPVAALAACHERIRTYTAGLARMAALPSLDDPRVPPSAAQAHRYFAEGLPLHAQDEDLSLAPRLLAVVPEARGLMEDLAADHVIIDRWLAELLPLLAALSKGEPADQEALRRASDGLARVLIPHIEREERELFELCARLGEADRRAFGEELAARRR